jgi:hypothetical protein
MLRLFKTSDEDEHDVLVRQITERLAVQMIVDLNQAAERMSPAELRGYVRARSRALVRQDFQAAGFGKPLSTNERQEQETRVVERIAHEVVRSLAAGPISTIPLPHVSMRKAA